MLVRILLAAVLAFAPAAAQKALFTAEAMMKLKRISDPSVAPDGSAVAYTVGEVDLAKNAIDRQIWISPLAGGPARKVTTEGRNWGARFSPDSKRIAFLSTRSGSAQVWVMDALGENPRQITRLSTEADGVIWSGDGRTLVFTSEVYPECNADDGCNRKRLEEEQKNPVRARVYDRLLYRHWNQWKGKRVRHLMAVSLEDGKVRDLTPGARYDVPPFSLGGGPDYAVSPDGKEVCYAANFDEDQALSTNWELYVVPIEGPGEGREAKKISTSPGADATPKYSPDGRWLAWRMQVRPGYESDRWRLVVLERETGQLTVLTENLDRHVTGFAWHPDSKRIAFTVEDRGRQQAHLIPVTGGGTRVITQGAAHVDDLHFTADGKTLVYTEMSGSSPVEIFRASSGGGAPQPVTRLNDALLEAHDLRPLEDFTVPGADNTPVHSFLLKPPAFDSNRKYPVLFLIHGGPQGAWGETFSYRWNPQVFASAGFVVVMPNPRGSTGYGTRFTDEINGDWGGRVYEDIMAVVRHVEKLPYVDPDRFAAAGGSYGGYMVNWILGHTDRFRALVSHAGVYDLYSMGGETEELWFTTWEFRGHPWENPEMYDRWSPSRFAANFRTPTLVIHGELDYRVPYGQGLQLFTALQVKKVPSKLVLFPDEGHWILKPQNSLFWYRTFLDWVTGWTAKKP
ncbi:MAG: S9 family peptidase [Bryobacteraceae bacterium]|nr:S9 family peptidase [Bryobacteraceae bacterium]